MRLVVDIGNTSLDLAVLQGLKVIRHVRTETAVSSKVLRRKVKSLLSQIESSIVDMEAVVICSVVPDALKIIELLLQKAFPGKVRVLGRDIIVPIQNRYTDPRQVGQDRLVCAYATACLYGYPAVVIDLGTAITFDIISAKREYLGGMIIPGIKLSADTLFQKTALLPLVKISRPRALIGTDTQGSILSGIFYGYGAMIRGMIRLIGRQLKARPKVIVTGGYADLMKKYISPGITAIDPDLVFKGMALICSKNSKARRKSPPKKIT